MLSYKHLKLKQRVFTFTMHAGPTQWNLKEFLISRIIIIMYSCNENDDDTVKPRYNEGPRDWQTLFTITRFCYIKVLFHYILLLLGRRKSFVMLRISLYRGLLYRVYTVHHSRHWIIGPWEVRQPMTCNITLYIHVGYSRDGWERGKVKIWVTGNQWSLNTSG